MEDLMTDPSVVVITLLALAFVLFILFRELMLWYWKVNKRIALLEENNRLLKSIDTRLGEITSPSALRKDILKS